MNTKTLKPFLSVAYVVFGIWLICSAIRVYHQIPMKQKYFELQETTYRQAHHIGMVYNVIKNGGKISADDLSRVHAYLNDLEQSKQSLILEIRKFPFEMENLIRLSDRLYSESEILKFHFDSNFKNWNSDESILTGYRSALNESINESVDCSISTADVYNSITGRTRLDDFLDEL